TPVGMQSAFDSAIGLPSSSTSASWMLGLLIPDEQSRNFTMPPVSSNCRRDLSMRVRTYFPVETARPPKTHRPRPGTVTAYLLVDQVAEARTICARGGRSTHRRLSLRSRALQRSR